MMAFHAGDQTSQALRREYQRRKKDWSQAVSSENHHNRLEVGLSLEASHLLKKSPVKINIQHCGLRADSHDSHYFQ